MKALQMYVEYEYIDSAIEPYGAAENTSVSSCQSTRWDISEDWIFIYTSVRISNLVTSTVLTGIMIVFPNTFQSSTDVQYNIQSCRPLGAFNVTLLFFCTITFRFFKLRCSIDNLCFPVDALTLLNFTISNQ